MKNKLLVLLIINSLLVTQSYATKPLPPKDIVVSNADVADPWPYVVWKADTAVPEPIATHCSTSVNIKQWMYAIKEKVEQDRPVASMVDKASRHPDSKLYPEKATASPISATVVSAPVPAPAMAAAPSPTVTVTTTAKSPTVKSSTLKAITPTTSDNNFSAQKPVVTAGVVDDNEKWTDYLEYLNRNVNTPKRPFSIDQHVKVVVTDTSKKPVANAFITVESDQGAKQGFGWRTNAKGVAWVNIPQLGNNFKQNYVFKVHSDNKDLVKVLPSSQGSGYTMVFELPKQKETQLNLDFALVIDATGSMGDEIAKISSSLSSVLSKVQKLPGNPNLCVSVLAYRDKGDQFYIKGSDFSSDYKGIESLFKTFSAAGGGDTPEALDEALHVGVHHLSWRKDAIRSLVIVTDASGHLDQSTPSTVNDMQAAAAKGIRVFSVAASGQSKEGEYQMRQISNFTAGKFVFLTYANPTDSQSGPGTKTVHDVKNYSTNTLDDLIIELLSNEISSKTK